MKVAFCHIRRMAWVGVIAALVSANATAAIYCSGQVGYLALNPDGTVNINVGFGTWGICSVASSIQVAPGVTFPAESCRAWYASMLASQKTGDQIGFYFTSSSSASNGSECSALGSWVWPNPYHMHVVH